MKIKERRIALERNYFPEISFLLFYYLDYYNYFKVLECKRI